MDANEQQRYDGGPDGARPRQSSRPSEEQKAARASDADARKKELSRKKRTKNLIEMGGVCSSFGFESPAQVETILEALTRSRRGPDRLRELGVRETSRWPGSDE